VVTMKVAMVRPPGADGPGHGLVGRPSRAEPARHERP
jgi:hypothetical protein